MEQAIVCLVCRSKKIKFFCQKRAYRLYKCLNCELVFVWPTPENLTAIYSREYFQRAKNDARPEKFGYVDYEEDKKATRKTLITYLERIAELTEGRKIFDVGAATGYFLDIAKSQGWETAGSEISGWAADAAKNKGHDVFLGELPNLALKNSYDAVTMWDVLEHLAEPAGYLRTANDILRPGGILAINTIDSSSWWAKILGKNWHAILPPEHLFFYSVKSLEQLLKDSGFEIIKKGKIAKRFSLSYICKMLADRYGLLFFAALSNLLDKAGLKVALPINLRDNVFILAIKKE